MSRYSRRELLEQALFAATAVATAGSLNREAGAEEPARPGRVLGPNDQIRLAVIGVRGQGKNHVSGYAKMNDVTVAALCDVDTSVFGPATKIVTDAGKPAPKTVQDLRRIMDDPSIDAVSIATPNHWHSLAAIWAMQAGKDVYVEKPVSHNVHEGRVLVDTARKYQRVCQAGTQIRSNPGARQAIEFVRSGKIGRVQVARGLCYKRRKSIGHMEPSTPPSTVDYDLWLGPAQHRPFQANKFHYEWHWQWDTGNGDLGNQGIHQMDVARWGLGKNELPQGVVSLGGRWGYEDDGQTPNTQVIFLDYGDSQLIFEVRGLETEPYRGAMVGNVFHGTDGYVVLTKYDAGAAFDKDAKMIQTFTGSGNHFRNFIDCMRSRKTENLNGEILEGHLSSALCHLGNVSYRLGRDRPFGEEAEGVGDNPEFQETLERGVEHLKANGVALEAARYRQGRSLKVDPQAETFGKDQEANALLTRDYREPYVVPKKA